MGDGNFCLVSARLSLHRHYPLTYFFKSSFRAVSEQFFFSDSVQFNSISLELANYFGFNLINLMLIMNDGNLCLVSARLSLHRHYPLTYFFQSSFRAVFFSDSVQFNLISLEIANYLGFNLINLMLMMNDGNLCLVSGRLSLHRHYPLSQISFSQISFKLQFKLIQYH